ncbi:MAG: LemA family protein [Candidatus Levyibacteriota bacterium]|nr:MAG: LemA family protein [Candidatus Levybacteria bacterium]
MNPFYIVLGILAIIALWIAAAYNGLVSLVNQTKNAWSDIDVQLKRRYDLIPNLVETVKGYAKHEKGVFEEVTKARSAAMSAKGVEEKGQAENMLTGALKSLFAVSENYPTLRASENFSKLQDELTQTENNIESSRRFYNANVRDLNTKIETVPTNIIANMFGFKQQEFFQAQASEKDAVKVSM